MKFEDIVTDILIFMALVLAAIVFAAHASARDIGQWENTDPVLRAWFSVLKQPDNPNISCCGEADAYWCDDVFVKDEQTFCRITDTRDDTPLRRPHLEPGTVIGPIPVNKLGPAKWGNPTGHTVVFLSYQKNIYCFVMGTGT